MRRRILSGRPQPAAPAPPPAPEPDVDAAPTPDEEPAVEIPESTLLPVQIQRQTLEDVSAALAGMAVEWWIISDEVHKQCRIGVHEAARVTVIDALRGLDADGYWAQARRAATPASTPAPVAAVDVGQLTEAEIISVFKPRASGGAGWTITTDYCCEIEFWRHETVAEREYRVAPRENRASLMLSMADFRLESAQWHDMSVKRPAALGRRMLGDVAFDIDIVYTWVDGEDPVWRAKRALAEGADEIYHPEATMESRFTHRDELRYSLRSLDYFAPWARRVFLVTDGQVPSWLDLDNPRLVLVDHTEIFTNPADLPSFNSNAIISNLHHIDGLAEHYIYMNDDVFFGRWTTPNQFFHPNGIARVSTSGIRRAFGEARPEDEPHFNLTRNIRALLEDEFGITISRAIRHTPHPQLRSVHYEMEERFKTEYVRTWGHPFRHHTDIVADQLQHYYAQIVGKAVPTVYPYLYINIMDSAQLPRIETLLAKQDRVTFCLNDAPGEGLEPIDPQVIADFLSGYYPLPSSFEIRDDHHPAADSVLTAGDAVPNHSPTSPRRLNARTETGPGTVAGETPGA